MIRTNKKVVEVDVLGSKNVERPSAASTTVS